MADVFVNTLPPRDLLSLQRDLLDLVDQLNTELNTRAPGKFLTLHTLPSA